MLYKQELANKKKFWHYKNYVILYALQLNSLKCLSPTLHFSAELFIYIYADTHNSGLRF